MLSCRQTKNHPDKLLIRSKRLTTKQSQIKTNKTIQTLKILPFSLLSTSLCLSFSLILSTPLFTSHLLKNLKQGSKPGPPLSTAQAFGFSASPPLRPSLILSLNLLSASLNSQLLSAHQPFTSGINIWALWLVRRLGPGGWFCFSVLGLQVFILFFYKACVFFSFLFFWVGLINKPCVIVVLKFLLYLCLLFFF